VFLVASQIEVAGDFLDQFAIDPPLADAKALSSVLSHITLIVRGIPAECVWIIVTASRVNSPAAVPPAATMRWAI
jgi:hypothetical protein